MSGGKLVAIVALGWGLVGCAESSRTETGKGNHGKPTESGFQLIEPVPRHTARAEAATTDTYLRTSTDFVSDDGTAAVGYSLLFFIDSGESHEETFHWTSATGTVSLGALPGVDPAAAVRHPFIEAVNPSASVVVGQAPDADGSNHAYRWTAATGMVDIAPPGAVDSEATLVSDDGSVVAGTFSAPDASGVFRWTSATGSVDLGTLPDGSVGFPYYLSPDGSVVAGTARLCTDTCTPTVFFRWTEASGMESLGTLSNYDNCSVVFSGMSYGSLMAGRCSSASGTEPFVWTETGGVRGLGALPPDVTGDPYAVSRDVSSAIVEGTTTSDAERAWRWTASSGLTEIFPPAGFDSNSFMIGHRGMSADGSVAVGTSTGADGTTGFRWSVAAGVEILQALPGHNRADASSVSEDGTLIAGVSSMWLDPATEPEPTDGPFAVVWRSGDDVELASDVLASVGAPPPGGLVLMSALVGRDARVLYGLAGSEDGLRAWVARLPD